MKYILPIVLSLVLGACSDSNKTSNEEPNSTVIEKTTALEVEKVEVKPVEVEPKAAPEAVKAEINGETIFNKCKSCHGNSAEKKALGASQVIKGWEAEQIKAALIGYRDGSYGGTMKNIMSAQAKSLSDEEIDKVSVYIHSL